ncbi:hypothetical protein SeMB42_g00055 [Synchytrium endobioticum]|uniref:Uncharacterized protein n=1 Tax=Synchytrium endobioticum TaxID=286115 RepID=A0A507D733_9FUNG|nr:hypothetical protein SeLEV6574_g02717 [Synchytrium endobioticum]TPX54977.1 hypothetical protein SeMB42_g00055 [Synchytrium endobioticum]
MRTPHPSPSVHALMMFSKSLRKTDEAIFATIVAGGRVRLRIRIERLSRRREKPRKSGPRVQAQILGLLGKQRKKPGQP